MSWRTANFARKGRRRRRHYRLYWVASHSCLGWISLLFLFTSFSKLSSFKLAFEKIQLFDLRKLDEKRPKTKTRLSRVPNPDSPPSPLSKTLYLIYHLKLWFFSPVRLAKVTFQRFFFCGGLILIGLHSLCTKCYEVGQPLTNKLIIGNSNITRLQLDCIVGVCSQTIKRYHRRTEMNRERHVFFSCDAMVYSAYTITKSLL